MTWTTLALIVGSGSVVAIAWKMRRRDPSTMSSAWLQGRLREHRCEHEGVSWRWPFNREKDFDQPWANRYREQERQRRRA